jgi:hypothetical protein
VIFQEERYVSIHGLLAFSTWLTGQPEHPLAATEEVVLKAGQVGQSTGQSIALGWVAMPLALWSGQIDTLEQYSTSRPDQSKPELERFAVGYVAIPKAVIDAEFDTHQSDDELA